jgi:hypothetical protein
VTRYLNSPRGIPGSLSRRDVLRAGGLLLPATALAPALFTRISRAATTSGGFDYYISTNGSNSNPGTLASPWAITAINTMQSSYAGKRLGILPGTYDVSSLMGTFHSPALQINGGPNSSTPTYIGTSDSSGQYQAGTATLDAKGSSGSYGGGNSHLSTVIGTANGTSGGSGGPGTPANWGNWTLDGLQITGFSLWALQVGSYDGTGGAVPNAVIQNCTFYGGNGVNGPYGGTHSGTLELYDYLNCTVHNCYFYNNTNTGADSTHFACITCWGGVGGGTSSGLTIEYCTLVNTGGIYGIYDTGVIYKTTIQQCYFDMTTAGSGTGVPCGLAILGFGNTGAAGLAGSVFRNNVFRGGGPIDASAGNTAEDYWAATAAYYNNTWDLAGGAGFGAAGCGFRFLEASGHTGIFSSYNNLCYDNGSTSAGYGYNACNTDGFAVCDYNIYGTQNAFTTYGSNGGGSPNTLSYAAWKSATGRDAHSSTSSANPFTNNGANALQYQVKSGSPAYQTGRVGGVASGAVCNVGAWDGTVTQIGYSSTGVATGSMAQPNPPVLTVS